MEKTTKVESPTINKRRRPNMSPILPETGCSAAIKTRYAVTTQMTDATGTFNPWAIGTNPTAIIVELMGINTTDRITAVNTQRCGSKKALCMGRHGLGGNGAYLKTKKLIVGDSPLHIDRVAAMMLQR